MSLHTFLCVQVGGALLDVLLKAVTFQTDANDPESKPIRAFYHVYEFLGERKVGYIKVKGTCTSDHCAIIVQLHISCTHQVYIMVYSIDFFCCHSAWFNNRLIHTY